MWTRVVIVAVAGALGAILANRGIAVFHDGLRGVMPEVMEGRMPRREFASIAFGMSFGLVLGFGIPFSLLSTILLYHTLWLGTDVIGAWFPGPFEQNASPRGRHGWGLIGAAIGGALYGIVLMLALDGLFWVFEQLPVKLPDVVGQLSGPTILTFAAFPAIAVAYQYGIRNGVLAFLITLLGRLIASLLGLANPDTWALAVGIAVLILYAIREKRREDQGTVQVAFSTEREYRVRSHLPAIAVLGAVYGLACNQAILMESPQSLTALATGQKAAAISITIARALSFTPLKVMSILATGVFAIDGYGFVATAGLASPNAIVALVAGAAVMSLEVLSLAAVARFLIRFPGMLKAADSIRTAMTRLLEIATLVGSMIAADRLASGPGFLAVAGLYLLNESAGTPVVRAAVGPVAVILVVITVSVLVWLHITPPA